MEKRKNESLLESINSMSPNHQMNNLIECFNRNKGLIISAASKFKPVEYLTIDDYIAIGNMAFYKSYSKFDPKYGSLSTFITICVNNAIKTAIKKIKSKSISVNSNIDNLSNIQSNEPFFVYLPDSLSKEEFILVQMLYDNYTGKEIQDVLGISKKEFKKLKHSAFLRIKRKNEKN